MVCRACGDEDILPLSHNVEDGSRAEFLRTGCRITTRVRALSSDDEVQVVSRCPTFDDDEHGSTRSDSPLQDSDTASLL